MRQKRIGDGAAEISICKISMGYELGFLIANVSSSAGEETSRVRTLS